MRIILFALLLVVGSGTIANVAEGNAMWAALGGFATALVLEALADTRSWGRWK